MKNPLFLWVTLLSVALTPVLIATTTIPTTTYNAGGTVTVTDPSAIQTGSSDTIIVSTGASVSYQAGSTVTLYPGFTANSGSFFNAFINSDLVPAQPTDLVVTSQSTGYINLLWFPSSDSYGGIYYKIYRNGTYIGKSNLPLFTDTSVTSGSSYTYTVMAFDADGNSSAISSPVVGSATNTESAAQILGLSSPTTVGSGTLSFSLLRPQ